jgi:hypothetical protein
MTDQTIQVVALVVAPDILTFYKTDGSVFTVTQGDPRGLAMSDEFFAQRKLGQEIITLIIGEDVKTATSHLDSKKRNPLIRFYRALKADVAKLLGAEVKSNELTEDHEAAAARVKEVAARLMVRTETTEAQPDDLPVRMVHSEEPLGKDETIIAVTADGVVGEVENLADQFVAADEGKAPAQGADQLLIRLAKVSSKRRHSAADLMRFLKHVDLPILADGSILLYKRLLHQGNGVYVDPHTRKVHQRIGDIVEMDESLVDPDRRRDCSNGLHVGSRQYMGSFHSNSEGAGTMLVLVQPEDAIAVPEYGTTKLRTCRYQIVADLSNKAHDLVNANQKLDSCKSTMDLIAAIVAGARPPALGRVRIGGGHGSNLTYSINGKDQAFSNMKYADALAVSQGKAIAAAPDTVKPVRTIDDSKNGHQTARVTPEKVRDKANVVTPVAAKAKAAEPKLSSRQIESQNLLKTMNDTTATHLARRTAAEKLRALKKQAKVTWVAMGLKDNVGDQIQKLLDQPAPSNTPAPKAAPKQSAPVPSAKKPVPAKTAPQPKAPVAAAPASTGGTRQDRARAMYVRMTDSKALSERRAAAQELQKFKSKAKVSWSALGLGKHNVEADIKKALS